MRYRTIVMCLSALLLLTVSVVIVTLLLKKHVPLLHPEGLTSTGCILDTQFPDETNCTTFYVCTPHGLQIFSCPLGLHFNPVANNCVSPDVAGCTNDIQESLHVTTVAHPFNITEELYSTNYQLTTSDDESVYKTHEIYFEGNSLGTSTSSDTLESEKTTIKNNLFTYSSNVPNTEALVNNSVNSENVTVTNSSQNPQDIFTVFSVGTDGFLTDENKEVSEKSSTQEKHISSTSYTTDNPKGTSVNVLESSPVLKEEGNYNVVSSTRKPVENTTSKSENLMTTPMNTELDTNKIKNEIITTLLPSNSTEFPENLTLINKSDTIGTKYSTLYNAYTKVSSTETSVIQNSTDILENSRGSTKSDNENKQTLSSNLNIENFTSSNSQNISEWNNNEYKYSTSERNELDTTQSENYHVTTKSFLGTAQNVTHGNEDANGITLTSSNTFSEKSTTLQESFVDGSTVTENNPGTDEEVLYDKIPFSQTNNVENDAQTLPSLSDSISESLSNDGTSNLNNQASSFTASKPELPEVLNNLPMFSTDNLENTTLNSTWSKNNTTPQSNYLAPDKSTKDFFLTESTSILNEGITNAESNSWKTSVTEVVKNYSSSTTETNKETLNDLLTQDSEKSVSPSSVFSTEHNTAHNVSSGGNTAEYTFNYTRFPSNSTTNTNILSTHQSQVVSTSTTTSTSTNPTELAASQTLQTSSLNIAEVNNVLDAIKELDNKFNSDTNDETSGNKVNDKNGDERDDEDEDEEKEEHRHHHKHKHHHG